MSSREFAEWLAYERVSGPLGPERGDILHAVLLAMIHNQWSNEAKKPKDFLPDWDRGSRKQSPDEMLAHLRMINAMAGGTVGEE